MQQKKATYVRCYASYGINFLKFGTIFTAFQQFKHAKKLTKKSDLLQFINKEKKTVKLRKN